MGFIWLPVGGLKNRTVSKCENQSVIITEGHKILYGGAKHGKQTSLDYSKGTNTLHDFQRGQADCGIPGRRRADAPDAVSYTHLTLPTT
mgnify:CR=1 FL=1